LQITQQSISGRILHFQATPSTRCIPWLPLELDTRREEYISGID